MSSSVVVPVTTIQNVREHPNASMLGLADVLGYQAVIALVEKEDGPLTRTFILGSRDANGKRIPAPADCPSDSTETVTFDFAYHEGEVVVYFPADTLLSDETAARLNVKALLTGAAKNRVSKIRLRGEPSFGIVAKLPEGVDWQVGDNVAEYWGATKYMPPVRATVGDAAPQDSNIDPYFEKYTGIENGRIFTSVFVEGEEVVYTEKIHGCNSRIGVVNGKRVAGSHSVRRKEPETLENNTYWFPWTLPGVQKMLESLGATHNVVLYGEIFGGSIQTLTYGVPKGQGFGFRAFDLLVDGKYVDFDTFRSLCQEYDVDTVPILERGPFYMEKVKVLADGKTTLANGLHMREGIVVKPVQERVHPSVGRVILKYIGTEYALTKGHSDFTDQ